MFWDVENIAILDPPLPFFWQLVKFEAAIAIIAANAANDVKVKNLVQSSCC